MSWDPITRKTPECTFDATNQQTTDRAPLLLMNGDASTGERKILFKPKTSNVNLKEHEHKIVVFTGKLTRFELSLK